MSEETLRAKLAAACDAVGGIEKKGNNELQRYKYIRAADVAKSIRHELFKRGIILIADEKEFLSTGEIPTKSGGILREFTLKVEYTLMDGYSDEKIVATAYGVAMDSGDKAIYKCKTGALKYFLRGLGLIPDEKDDPEADSDVDAKIKDAEKRFDAREAAQSRISPTQAKAFWKAVKEGGKTEDQVRAYLTEIGPYVQTEHMRQDEYNEAIRWATNPVPVLQDLLPALNESLSMANAKKASVAPAKAADPIWAPFWLKCKDHGVTKDDAHTYAKEHFGMRESLKELTAVNFSKLCDWVESQQP